MFIYTRGTMLVIEETHCLLFRNQETPSVIQNQKTHYLLFRKHRQLFRDTLLTVRHRLELPRVGHAPLDFTQWHGWVADCDRLESGDDGLVRNCDWLVMAGRLRFREKPIGFAPG